MSHATLIKLDRRQPPSPLYFPDRDEDLAVQQPALDDELPPLSFPSKEVRAASYTLVDEENDLPIIAGSIFDEDELFTPPRASHQPPNRYVNLVIAITLDPDFGGYHNGIDEGFVLDQPSIEW